VSRQDVALAATTLEVQNDAWQVLLSWVAFGGDASSVTLEQLRLVQWHLGALELVRAIPS
jgi:hypothetical protein